MASDKQSIECVIDMQADGLYTYIGNLVELENALDRVIATAEANGRLVGAMQFQKVRTEIERQLEGSREILNELEQLKWTVVPLAPPPDLCE
jgi:transcriptional regulator with AAA-type ATPase domain